MLSFGFIFSILVFSVIASVIVFTFPRRLQVEKRYILTEFKNRQLAVVEIEMRGQRDGIVEYQVVFEEDGSRYHVNCYCHRSYRFRPAKFIIHWDSKRPLLPANRLMADMGVDDAEMAEWLAAASLDKRTVVAALSSPFDHERRLMLERLISAESLDPIVQQRIEQLTDDENAAIRAAAFALLEGVPNK